MKTYLFLFITLLFSMSCKPECSEHEDCSAFSPPPEDAITCARYVEGYYYDSERNECIYYAGSACSAPPFEKKSDCKPCKCAD